MSIGMILGMCAVVLAFNCLGLLAVRLSNPRLAGLGWLAAAFAAGGIGSVLLLGSGHLPSLLTVGAADVLVLLSFVLLHVAVLKLIDEDTLPWVGFCLLAVQAATDLAKINVGLPGRARMIVASLLIAIQTIESAMLLARTTKKGIRAPAIFSALLLFGFGMCNVVRSVALAEGTIDHPELFYRVQAWTFLMYLAFALGIAFAFFWTTTSSLTASLDELASTDPLTRLYNRRVFQRWCERELARSQKTAVPFTILMVDLDHFKAVNDRFGHAGGDVVLCAVVEKMQDSVRGIDVLSRWGGEEFAVLLPGASSEAALIVAQRVRQKIEGGLIPVTGPHPGAATEVVRVTASVGMATYQGEGDSLELMLSRADRALYAAKAGGRNQVLVDSVGRAELLGAHSV